MALKRYTFNVDEELMEQIDQYAASLHISRTAAISVLVTTALDAKKNMNTLEDLMSAYRAEQSKQTGMGG